MSKKVMVAAAIAVGAVGIVAAGVVLGAKYLKKTCEGLTFTEDDFMGTAPKAPINPECAKFDNCKDDCAVCEDVHTETCDCGENCKCKEKATA